MSRRLSRRRQLPVVLAVFVGLALSGALVVQTYRWEQGRFASEFHRIARDRVLGILERTTSSLEVLRSIRSLYDASVVVDRQEFEAFVHDALIRHPEILALEWTPRVPAGAQEEHIAQMRAEGLEGYSIRAISLPAREGEAGVAADEAVRDRFPIVFVEPQSSMRELLGVDLASEATRRETMERARDLDAHVATRPIMLLQTVERGEHGLVTFLPVYASDVPLETQADRARALEGYVVAVFRVGAIVSPLAGAQEAAVEIDVLDGSEGGDGRPLVLGSVSIRDEERPRPGVMSFEREFLFAGQRLILACRPTAAFLQRESHRFSYMVGLAGLLFASMLATSAHSLASRNWLIERRVAERTAQLATQYAAARALATAPALPEAVEQVLRFVCETLDWDLGVYWEVDRRGSVLLPLKIWCTEQLQASSFERATSELTVAEGEGLAGRVWQSRSSEWIPDVVIHPGYLRAHTAVADGMHAGIAIPVLHGGEVHGVFEFASRRVLDEDPDLLSALATIGTQVGLFVERKDAEEALRRSEERYRDLFENASDLIQSTAPDGKLLYVNRAWRETLGYTAEEVSSLTIFDIIHPDSSEHCNALMARVFTGEHLDRVEAVFRAKDGRAISVEGMINCRFEDGTPVSTRAIFRDVTDRLRVQQELQHALEAAESANRAKSEFLASMSHELRTPLNSVIGFAGVLIKNKNDSLGETEMTYLGRILDNGKHLLGLINQVLDLSKIEAGRAELDIVEVSLPELVEQTAEQLRGNLRDQDVELVHESPDAVEPISTDADKLRQVIINLVGNALKFTETGRVTVRVLADPSTHVARAIEVVDTGVGIPAHRLEHIFEAFRQADSSTTRRFGGTGLGLAISRSLCLALGHRLEAESEVGKGSTFRIVFQSPGATGLSGMGRAESQSTGDDQVDSLVERQALVIDDDRDSRFLIANYLEELGCTVLEAASGEEGIRLASELKPDVITLDLMMPDVDGWDVLRRLKENEETARIPVVVVSIVASEERGKLVGAVDFVDKPIDRSSLVRAIARNSSRERGRVLALTDDENVRHTIGEVLDELGLDLDSAAPDPTVIAGLDLQEPDLVLLDLGNGDRAEVLSRLQGLPALGDAPLIFLCSGAAAREELRSFASFSAAVLSKDPELADRLRRVVIAAMAR